MAEMNDLDLSSRLLFTLSTFLCTLQKLQLTLHSAASFTFSNDLMINAGKLLLGRAGSFDGI